MRCELAEASLDIFDMCGRGKPQHVHWQHVVYQFGHSYGIYHNGYNDSEANEATGDSVEPRATKDLGELLESVLAVLDEFDLRESL